MVPDDTASDSGTLLDPSQVASASDINDGLEAVSSGRREDTEDGEVKRNCSGAMEAYGSRASRRRTAEGSRRSTDIGPDTTTTTSRSSRSLASSSTSPTSLSPTEDGASLEDELELLKSLFPNLSVPLLPPSMAIC